MQGFLAPFQGYWDCLLPFGIGGVHSPPFGVGRLHFVMGASTIAPFWGWELVGGAGTALFRECFLHSKNLLLRTRKFYATQFLSILIG